MNSQKSPDPGKYRVTNTHTDELLAPGTFFVLKAGDPVAYAALWGYVHTLTTLTEQLPESDPRMPEYLDRLQVVSALAQQWQALGETSS